MRHLQLVVDQHHIETVDDDIRYLNEHFHEYEPEQWKALYSLLTEASALEQKLRQTRMEQLRQRTSAIYQPISVSCSG